jgi:hypothetical protein
VVGLSEVLMMSAVVVQAALVVGIVYGGVRMMRRHGFGRKQTEPAPEKPIGI